MSQASDHHAGEAYLSELLRTMPDGRIKLYVLWRLLALRRRHEALFRDGDYLALRVEGQYAEHVCAFARRREKGLVVVIVQRLTAALGAWKGELPTGERWDKTWIETPMLPPGTLGTDIFSGQHARSNSASGVTASLSARDVFAVAPFSVVDFSV